ncbi:MAG TPA: hypothetical protein VL049_27810, partial [Candidatus Dormibacteraeota bacterium]|nr:hypothetical protein [Candidatus Dormibacteraeota bacterium]
MNSNRRALLMLLTVADLAVVGIAYVLAVANAAAELTLTPQWDVLEMRVSIRNLLALLAYLALWHGILRAVGLYRSYRLSAASRELRDIATAVGFGVLPLAALMPFGWVSHVTPSFVLAFALLAFVGLSAERRLLRALGRRLRLAGRNLRNVV